MPLSDWLPTIPDSLPAPFARRVRSFQYHLEGAGVSRRTIQTYLGGIILLGEWLATAEHSGVLEEITAEELRRWLGHLAQQTHYKTGKPWSASTINNRARAVQAFWRWAAEEYDLPDPMQKVRIPKPGDPEIPELETADLKLLLEAAKGKDFASRRDTAFLRLAMDSGARLAELALIRKENIDLPLRKVAVLAKGRVPHEYMFGAKTVAALDRYLDLWEARQGPGVTTGPLWLGRVGPLTVSGCYQLIRDRAAQAAELATDPAQAERLRAAHPHTFRHTAAIRYLDKGGQQENLNTLMNWRSPTMAGRYIKRAKRRLAAEEYRRLNIGDDV